MTVVVEQLDVLKIDLSDGAFGYKGPDRPPWGSHASGSGATWVRAESNEGADGSRGEGMGESIMMLE